MSGKRRGLVAGREAADVLPLVVVSAAGPLTGTTGRLRCHRNRRIKKASRWTARSIGSSAQIVGAIVSAGRRGIYIMPRTRDTTFPHNPTRWADAPGTHPRHVQAAAHKSGFGSIFWGHVSLPRDQIWVYHASGSLAVRTRLTGTAIRFPCAYLGKRKRPLWVTNLNWHTARGSYQHNTLLPDFRRRQQLCLDAKQRLALVREYAAMILPPDPFFPPLRPQRTRGAYKSRRADGWAVGTLRKPCWVCMGAAKHRHHVIPIAGGGRNRKDNLVPLCVACHHSVHGRTF